MEARLKTDLGHSRDLNLSWQRRDGEWKKQAGFQGDSVARLSDFLGCIPLSLFTPQDLSLVNGAPAQRRKYLDLMLSKMSGLYLQELSRLRKVLSSRNALLRQQRPWAELQPWNRLLFQLSSSISRHRRDLIENLSETCQQLHQALSGQETKFRLAYRACCPKNQDEFEERLQELHEREMQNGSSLLSPQKDELEIQVRDRSLRTYGSQGEQRLAALCLRLAEAQILAEHKDESAILLLDDAFSELDQERRTRLLALLPQFSQVFLTSSNPLGIQSDNLHSHRVEGAHILSGATLL